MGDDVGVGTGVMVGSGVEVGAIVGTWTSVPVGLEVGSEAIVCVGTGSFAASGWSQDIAMMAARQHKVATMPTPLATDTLLYMQFDLHIFE